MINVRVRVFATLRRFFPGLAMGEPVPVSLQAGATVRDLAAHLGVPAEEVKLIFANGLSRDLDYVLAEGDDLGLFPPVGGG
jgi:molybdopterin converting factor small subunit